MKASPERSNSPRWIWIAAIWLGIGLFNATQTVVVMRAEGMHHNWRSLFVTLFLAWLPWACATPIVLRLGQRYPVGRLAPLSVWFIHLSACAAIGLSSAGLTAALETALNPWAVNAQDPFLQMWRYKFYSGLLGSAILYALILAFSLIIDAGQRLANREAEAARISEQLSKAQLDALRRQIEPHFLFNTLNAISGLVRDSRSDDAVKMIAALSDFLRRIVRDSSSQQVPLGEEIDFLEKYLDIQKMRFAERLQVSVEVPEDLHSAQVPALILQPIVENSVKHGIAARAQGGAVRIAAARVNGDLKVRIYNDGPRLSPDWEQTTSGVGISNIRTRLENLYGDGFQFMIQNREPGGVEVSLSLPFKEK